MYYNYFDIIYNLMGSLFSQIFIKIIVIFTNFAMHPFSTKFVDNQNCNCGNFLRKLVYAILYNYNIHSECYYYILYNYNIHSECYIIYYIIIIYTVNAIIIYYIIIIYAVNAILYIT